MGRYSRTDNLSSIWKLEPHTGAKHELLRHYLAAWYPILARYNGRVAPDCRWWHSDRRRRPTRWLQARSWEATDGTKRRTVEVVAETFKALSSKPSSETAA